MIERGTRCRVCRSRSRDEIDSEIVSGRSYRDIAATFGLSKDSIWRHKQEGHVSSAVVALVEKQEAERGESLLAEVRTLLVDVRSILAEAKESGSGTTALKAVREATRLLELKGRLTGDLIEQPAQVTNVLVAPEWLQVRGALFDALLPFPEAREAVARALGALDRRALEAG